MGLKVFIRPVFLFCSVVISALILMNCGGGKETLSNWNNQEIIIDGNISDWQNTLVNIPEKKISVGFKNDNKFLYICLTTNDRIKLMQMFRSGFITWFTPNGDQNKKFGVKYPLANKLQLNKEQMQNIAKEIMQPGNLENLVNQYLGTQKEIEILSKDKFLLNQFPTENNEGIKAKLGYSLNYFVLELQIPLASNNEYSLALDAVSGESVNVTFETEKSDLSNLSGGANRGSSQSGTGRMMPGAGALAMLEPINYSIDIKLQKQPN